MTRDKVLSFRYIPREIISEIVLFFQNTNIGFLSLASSFDRNIAAARFEFLSLGRPRFIKSRSKYE